MLKQSLCGVVGILLPGIVACNSTEESSEEAQPRWNTTMKQQAKVDPADSAVERIERRFKLLDHEEKLALARLELSFAEKRLLNARELVRLKVDENSWWPSWTKMKEDHYSRKVESLEDNVEKLEEKLQEARQEE